MAKTRSALLIEGKTKREVAAAAAKYLNTDAGGWVFWNHPEKYMSGGWFAVLVLEVSRRVE